MPLLYRRAQEEEAQVNVYQSVEAFDKQYTLAGDTISDFIKFCSGWYPDVDVSAPYDIMALLFGVAPEEVSMAVSQAESENYADIYEVFMSIWNNFSTSHLWEAIGMTSPGIPDISVASDEKGYVFFAGKMTEVFSRISTYISGLKEKMSKNRDYGTAQAIINSLLASHILDRGTAREGISVDQSGKDIADEAPRSIEEELSPTEEEIPVEKAEGKDPLESKLREYEKTTELKSTSLSAEIKLNEMREMISGIEGKVGDMSDHERKAFIAAVSRFADRIDSEVADINNAMKKSGSYAQDKIGNVIISLITNELMELAEDKIIPKNRLGTLQAIPEYNDPKVVYDLITKNYADFIDKKHTADFSSMLHVLKKIADGSAISLSDMSTMEQGASKTSDRLDMKRPKEDTDKIPLSKPDRISEMKNLLGKEARRISEFMYWKMFNNLPSVLELGDKSFGLMPGKSRTVMPSFSRKKSGVVNTGDAVTYVDINKFNNYAQSDKSTRLSFRNRVFGTILGVVNGSAGVNMAGPEAISDDKRKERYPYAALANDRMTGSPTTIDSETMVKLGKTLYGICNAVPDWKEGGEESDARYNDIKDEVTRTLFSYICHLNVGINTGGAMYVSTLYNVAMNSLLMSVDSGDDKKFSQDKRAIESLVGKTCPWVKRFSLNDISKQELEEEPTLIVDALSEAGAGLPEKPDGEIDYAQPYSGRTSEQAALLSKAVVYLVKSYCNMTGQTSVGGDGARFLQSLTLDGKNIIDTLLDLVVANLTVRIRSHKSKDKGRSSLKEFKHYRKDPYLFIFGSNKSDLYNTLISSLGGNIGYLFSKEESQSGVPSVPATNAKKFRDIIGIIANDISRNTGMIGTNAFDISMSLANRGGWSDGLGERYGDSARNLMENVANVLDSATYSSAISSNQVRSTAATSTISVPSRLIPPIISGAIFNLLDENGNVVATGQSRIKPTVRIDGDNVEITFQPGFGNVNLANIRELQIDYTGVAPDSSSYGMHQIFTGRHLKYADDMSSRYKELKKSIEDLKKVKGKVVDASSVLEVADHLKQLQKSLWNTIAALPSIDELKTYSKLTGDPQQYLITDTSKLVESLNKMVEGIHELLGTKKRK